MAGGLMQVELLQEFIVVANQLNFRKASDELHLTRSTLSKHISALEKELGFKLLEREGAVMLTPAGKVFYAYAQQILNLFGESIRKCEETLRSNQPPRVQWSGQESWLFGRLCSRITTPLAFVKPSSDTAILSSLTSGWADVVFVYDVENDERLAQELASKGLAYTVLGVERLSIAMSRENPLARAGALSQDDLRDVTIMGGYGSLFEHTFSSLIHAVGGGTGARILQNASLASIDDLLYIDMGNAIFVDFREIADQLCRRRNDFVSFDEVDGRPITITTCFAHRADEPNRQVRAFLDEALALAASDAS